MDSTHILSAAHCFDEINSAPQTFVVVTENTQTGQGEIYNQAVRKIDINPRRVQGNPVYDMALITLAVPLPLDRYPQVMRAIPLARSSDDLPKMGEFVIVSGYGKRMFETTQRLPDTLETELASS